MNAGLTLTTLGDLAIYQNGEIIADLGSRKAEALLVYLVVEQGAPIRRDRLLTLLWPDMPEQSARHNLRQALYELRQAFPEVRVREGDTRAALLLSDRQTVQINPDVWLEADVHVLARLLRVVDLHEHLSLLACTDCLRLLEQVAELYSGDFLRDFYLEDSNQFEDWAAANREACRSRALSALETLTEAYSQQGQYDRARAYADRQLQIDPLRESAYRQMMELHAKSGQRAEALRVYRQCAQILEIELGTHPSRKTTALFELIRGEDLRRAELVPTGGSIRGYELCEHLGSGHAGMVYRARQPVIGRDVAIKVILPQYASHPDFIRRFEVEAQLVARLEHPYIVPLYDYWRDPSGAYLVMRWLKGGSLQADLARGPWKPAPAVRLVEQVASALALAHRQGVVHCDIKPANILLDEAGNAYLTDFGIASLTGPLAQLSQYRTWADDGSSTGSLGYAAPESGRGGPPSTLADIYSLGVVLFELLTGAHPFPQFDGEALVQKHLTEALPSVLALRPELPEEVDAVIQKATRKDPELRYPDVSTLAHEFRRALMPEVEPVPEVPFMAAQPRNPYKGLRPFDEVDALDFFGRDELVARLLEQLGSSGGAVGPSRFLAVVGPSGSGKSSVVKAGLIPAVRRGDIPGSERWYVIEMTPGSHPLEELETALLRIAIQTPEDLLAQFQSGQRGFLRVLRRALPEEGSEVLLVIDQFEELFTLVAEEAERNHFLDMLATAVADPHSPLRLVLTLRADFYDRPLQHGGFGELVRTATEVVLPLHPEELQLAICGPAERVGVSLEPALVARILQEVGDQPGALPLLQYALTELFERRQARQLTLEAYEASGGVLGALGRQAEEIFAGLSPAKQETTRQLFLRLITLGEGVEDTRRRVLRSELEVVTRATGESAAIQESGHSDSALAPVIDRFGRYRLLTFDHDPATRAPTVEVAHEALLREWPRLRAWLDESRDDIRMQRLLGVATHEWLGSGRDAGFLLRGARLDQFSLWADDTGVALTQDEGAYLQASLEKRRERKAAEAERQAHEVRLEQRARRFLRVLVGVFAVAALVAIILSGVAFRQGDLARQNAATAVSAQGEALVLADSRATQQAIAEGEARARATQQALALAEAEQRAAAEAVAQDNLRLARANELGTVAINLMEKQPDLAFLLSVEAYRQAETMHNWTALYSVGTHNPRLKMVLHGHMGRIESLAYSPDGKAIASGGLDGRVLLWDMDPDSSAFGTFIELPSDGDLPPVESLDFSPDGRLLAAGTTDGTKLPGSPTEISHVLLWDVSRVSTSYRQLLKHYTSEELVLGKSGVAFSPSDSILAVAKPGRIEFLDVDPDSTGFGQMLGTVGGSDSFFDLTFSPDGKTLAAGDCWYDFGDVFLWRIDPHNVSLSREVAKISPFLMCGLSISYTLDSNLLAMSFDSDLNILIWNVDTNSPSFGEVLMKLGDQKWIVTDLDISPDGKRLASVGGSDEAARLWDIDPKSPNFGQEVSLSLQHANFVDSVVYSPDGETLAVGASSGMIYLWDLTLENLPTLEEPPETNFGLLESEISSEPIYPHPLETLLLGHTGIVEGVAFSPDGTLLASAGGGSLAAGTGDLDGTIRLWDVDPASPGFGQQIGQPMRGHTAWVTGIAYDPDGTRLASSSGDGTVHLWDVDPKSPSFQQIIGEPMIGHEAEVYEVAFSPDGRMLATSDQNQSVFLWDVDPASSSFGHALIRGDQWEAHSRESVIFSPDGKMLASAPAGERYLEFTIYEPIQLWDVDPGSPTYGQLINELKGGHWAEIFRLRFHPNGKILASASDDGTICLWDVDPDSPTYGKVIVPPLVSDGLSILGISFSPDGKFLATGNLAIGNLQLWDVDPGSPSFGQPLGVPLNQGDIGTVTLDYSPDGKFFAVGDNFHRIHLWNVDPAAWTEYVCGRAGRNLTKEEWELYLSWAGPYNLDYKTCPQWP